MVEDEDLRGLATLLAFYIHQFHDPNAEKPADYAKGVQPILAKTNFAEMFRRLPEKEKKKYSDDRDMFVELILEIVNDTRGKKVPNVTKTDPVITGKAVDIDVLKKVKQLTLEAWLSETPIGKDNLTQQYYPELFGFGNLGGTETKVGTGEKVDKTPEGKAAMVLEFRAGAPAPKGFLAPDQWRGFAHDYLHLVRRLHGSEDI